MIWSSSLKQGVNANFPAITEQKFNETNNNHRHQCYSNNSYWSQFDIQYDFPKNNIVCKISPFVKLGDASLTNLLKQDALNVLFTYKPAQ
jgi:hypothetical protein